jgi:hypothetical protein
MGHVLEVAAFVRRHPTSDRLGRILRPVELDERDEQDGLRGLPPIKSTPLISGAIFPAVEAAGAGYA